MSLRVLLGPQRTLPVIGEEVAALTDADETVAVISAGWQEAENDLEDLHKVVQRPLEDLLLYGRSETLTSDAPELGAAHRERQDTLRQLQRQYRLRLGHLMQAAEDIFEVSGDLAPLDQRHAITQLRALDRHHLQRLAAAHARYLEVEQAHGGQILADVRGTLQAQLDGVRCVIITGGNVGVLSSRLRLLGLKSMLADKHIVAWSGGAMALCERVVLYHDRAPQGLRDAEIFDEGLGLAPGLVVLPNARRRLDTTRTTRLGLMSRRFAPRRVVTLDPGQIVRMKDDKLDSVTQSRRLTRDGELKKLKVR
ncbi:MAG: hypothetical protein AB8G16_18390 [Gammaproteobacteria bacterium]